MITYDKLFRNPSAFRSLTGLDRLLFDRLYVQVEQALAQRPAETTRKDKKLRQRKAGAGRKYAHELRSPEAVMDAFPDVALIIDGKEQRIRRPKTKKDEEGNTQDTQKPYYSGK